MVSRPHQVLHTQLLGLYTLTLASGAHTEPLQRDPLARFPLNTCTHADISQPQMFSARLSRLGVVEWPLDWLM